MKAGLALRERLLQASLAIQQIPAPTFEEMDRACFMRDRFVEAGLEEVFIDEVNNVYARLAGRQNRPPLVISAHLDTVFPENMHRLPEVSDDRIAGPGIGDNSLGLAGLLGVGWFYKENGQQPDGDIWRYAYSRRE